MATTQRTTWTPWQTESDGYDDDARLERRWQHRYIRAITVDGVRYKLVGESGGTMVGPDGRPLPNVGRGEVRDYRRPDTTYAVYAEDGGECDGEPHRLDAEDECRRAIREATIAKATQETRK